jgi:hypothetical protein
MSVATYLVAECLIGGYTHLFGSSFTCRRMFARADSRCIQSTLRVIAQELVAVIKGNVSI